MDSLIPNMHGATDLSRPPLP